MKISNKEELKSKILNGMTIQEISDEYGYTWSDVYQAVAPLFNKEISDLSELEKNEIIEMYKNRISTTKIAEKYKVHHKRVSAFLKENGITISQKYINRKYELNEHYFDNINTPNKAYILGFLYADGYNSQKKSTVTMSLQVKDYEILEKIRKEIGSERELEFIEQSKRKDKNNDYKYNDMYRLLMFSKHMSDELANKGMIQNKSLILEFPEWLDKDLYRHFIRGYYDGDGSICLHRKNNGYIQSLITFTSTDSFCKRVQEIIKEFTCVSGGGIYDASSHNGVTRVLSLSGCIQCLNVLNWMYKDAELFMKRKYDKYLELLDFYELNKPQSA